MKTELPMRSSAWSDESRKPSDELVDTAVAATLAHPLAQEALGFYWHHAVVLVEAKEFLSGIKKPEIRAALPRLAGCSDVLLVSYHTSDTKPQPLSGAGRTFDFVLHPKTFEILASSTGTWRS